MTDNRRRFLPGRSSGPVPEEVTARLNRQHERIAELERELARVSPQVAALEERLAGLATSPAPPDLADLVAAGEVDPGELLAAIRAEHSRIRARISAAAKYEERLRQLEEKVEALEQR